MLTAGKKSKEIEVMQTMKTVNRSSSLGNKLILPPTPSKSITITINPDGTFRVVKDQRKVGSDQQIKEQTEIASQNYKKEKKSEQ
jgi:hypothetical protein